MDGPSGIVEPRRHYRDARFDRPNLTSFGQRLVVFCDDLHGMTGLDRGRGENHFTDDLFFDLGYESRDLIDGVMIRYHTPTSYEHLVIPLVF